MNYWSNTQNWSLNPAPCTCMHACGTRMVRTCKLKARVIAVADSPEFHFVLLSYCQYAYMEMELKYNATIRATTLSQSWEFCYEEVKKNLSLINFQASYTANLSLNRRQVISCDWVHSILSLTSTRNKQSSSHQISSNGTSLTHWTILTLGFFYWVVTRNWTMQFSSLYIVVKKNI